MDVSPWACFILQTPAQLPSVMTAVSTTDWTEIDHTL